MARRSALRQWRAGAIAAGLVLLCCTRIAIDLWYCEKTTPGGGETQWRFTFSFDSIAKLCSGLPWADLSYNVGAP
jgi:hypothetical protein